MAGTPFEEFLSRQKSTAQKGAGSSPFEEFLNRRKAQDAEFQQQKSPIKQIPQDTAGKLLVTEMARSQERKTAAAQDSRERSYAERMGMAQPVSTGSYGAAISASKQEAPPAASKISERPSYTGQSVVLQKAGGQVIKAAESENKGYGMTAYSDLEIAQMNKAYYDQLWNEETVADIDRQISQYETVYSQMGYGDVNALIDAEEKLKTLRQSKAQLEYNRKQSEDYANQIIMLQDIEEIQTWPEEDQALLKEYVYNRAGGARAVLGQNPLSFLKATRAGAKLHEKYGDRFEELAESWEWYDSAKGSEQLKKLVDGALGDDGNVLPEILHSIGTVPANLVGAATGINSVLTGLIHKTGRYSTLNPNSVGFLPQSYASQVRQDVTGQIEGEEPNIVRKGFSSLYNAGMSAADTLARLAVGGEAGSLALSFTGSFSSSVQSASQQGASPEQAVLLGVIDGGLEVLTEKVSLDNLLGQIGGNPKAAKTILKNMFRSGMVEVSEEELNFLVSTLAEAAILREESAYQQQIQTLIAEEGLSYTEAVEQANRTLVNEAVNTMVTSYLSGSMMSGGTQLTSNWMTKRQQRSADLTAPNDGNQGEEISKNGGVAAETTLPGEKATEQGTPVAATQQGTGLELRAVDKPFVAPGTAAQNETAVPQNTVAVPQNADHVTENVASVPQNADHVTENVASVPENIDRSTTNEHISLAEQMRRNNQMGGIVSETGLRLGEAFESPARGAGVSDGGIQWNGSQSAREQAGSVAEGAEQAAQRQTVIDQRRATIDRQNRLRSLPLSRISSAELGLPSGTEQKNIRLVPQEYWDTEMGQIASRVYQETGKQVSFVIGPIQIRRGDGRVRNVNGVMFKDRIVVRADHLRLSMEQIADHEAYHGRVDYFGDMLNQEIKRHIVENFSEDEFREVLTKYLQAMRGVYDTGDIQTGEEFEKLAMQIQEEVFADAYAGINAFGAGADRFTAAVNERMEQLGVGRQRSQENGVRETNGPPDEKFSVNPDFAIEIDQWISGEISGVDRFMLGTTGDVLQGLGAIESDIYMLTEKISTIMEEHPEITVDEIKKIPQIVEDPILIVKSKGIGRGKRANTRLVVFGSVNAKNGKPVLAVLDLRPVENNLVIDDMQKISSAYTKTTDPVGFVSGSDVVYADKKRTAKLLRTIGFHMPIELQQSGYIGSISYAGQNVNINGIPFSDIVRKTESEHDLSPEQFRERYGLKLRAVDEVESGTDSQTLGEENNQADQVEKFSVDDEDYDALESEFQAQQSGAREAFLRERLGDEGYEKYKADRKSQADQKKKDTKVRDQVRRQVETNKRKLHVEAETAKINQEEQRRLRDETKPTKAKRVLKDTMLNLFSIPVGSKAELGAVIDSYAERLIKNGSLTDDDRKAFFDRMYDAGVMTVPADEYFSEGRNLLKGGRVYVSDSVRKDFGDDWGDIRRRAFGAGIYLTSDRNAGGIDQWNHELAQELPGLFDSEETDDRSILERIVQLAEEGKDEKVSLAEYTARLADAEHIPEDEFLNNMERQMDWALRNFANAAGIEISTKEQAIRQQATTRKQNLKLQATLAAERQERKEKAQRARDRQELRELQQKTLKQLQWLNKNRNRAPEELKETWDEVLSDIDIYAVGAANEMQWSDKHSATWKDLVEMYDKAKAEDPNFFESKELERFVARLRYKKLEDLDIDALDALYKLATGLRTKFYNQKNVINDEMQRLFAEVYTDSKREIESAPGENSAKKGKVSGWADKFLNMDQLTPMNVLQRMAGWDPDGAFYSMAKQLERGERDMRAYSVKAQKMLQDFLTEHEDWVKKADGQGKDGLWYKIEIPELVALELGKTPQFGGTIEVWMTPMQKIHMYLESKNQDNLRHMTGGRTFADKQIYSEGKRQEAFAQGKTVRMAPETVKAIVKDLTAEEMELAQILDRYYNSFATQEINKVSNILYGYDKAMGKNYAPIYTNRNYTKTEFGVFDTTAEGVGNLKGRQYAVNPSYNISCFDAFEKHVDQTARFVGMAIPARNWTNLMNWREKNNSTADVITHKWGEEGKRYISDLITTLQGGDDHKTESVSSGVAKLQSNYISAIFGSNPSIVLKQLGSIPMGGAYLGMRNLPTPAQLLKIDRELISRYTSELDWRTMGYATPETKQLKENPNWTQTNKFYRFAFGGGAITAMDGWAASTLWPWAENKVRSEYPDLEVGTQAQIVNGESEFYKKVADEFEVALARSQSTSDEIHQSTIRKSDNVWAKAFTMFRSDSAQTYNAIRQKIGEARYYARTGADKQTVKSANKAVGAAFGGLLLNAVWAEAITFLMALRKHKEDKYAEDDGELTVGSVAKEMTKGMLGSIAGMVTGGEELFEIIGNIVSGDEKWYGIDTPGLEQLNDLLDAVIDSGSGMRDIIAGAVDVVKNQGDLGAYISRHSGDILGNIKTVAETVAMYFNGLPVSNVEAYLIGALKWISPELGAAYDDVFSDVSKRDLSGMHGNALASRIEDILSDRKASNSDDTAQALAQLYEAGYKKAVPSDTPSTVTIDGAEHTLGAYQKQAYEMIWGSIVSESLDDLTSSENFKDADQKTQEKMISYLYTYAGEVAKAELFEGYEPNTRDEAIEAFSKVGLDMADFLYVYGKYSEIYNLDKSATLKAVEFAHWVQSEGYTAKQAEVIKEELAYYNMSPASSSRYDKMVGDGVNPDEAYDLTMEMAGLEPLEGETQIADVQRWRLAVDSSYVTATQFSMLKGMMSDKQFSNAQTANTFGVSPDAFVGYYEIRTKHDKDGNGAYNQAEVKAAIDSMGKYHLSTEEKAALWQIVTGTKSAKNNPYSVSVGERVLKYLSND